MASPPSASADAPDSPKGQSTKRERDADYTPKDVQSVIDSLKKRVPAERGISIKKRRDRDADYTPKDVQSVIDSFKQRIAAERGISIKKSMEESKAKLVGVTNDLYRLSMERRTCSSTGTQSSLDLLTRRQQDAIAMYNDIYASKGDKESNGYHEDNHASTAVHSGSNVAEKKVFRPVKLPEVKRLPPYTTWIFLDSFENDAGKSSQGENELSN